MISRRGALPLPLDCGVNIRRWTTGPTTSASSAPALPAWPALAPRRGAACACSSSTARPSRAAACTRRDSLVKEAAERWEIPATLTRRVRGIRLYAPALATLDLAAPGYYFLATDTPALMRWFAREARRAGAHLRFARPFRGARRVADGFELLETGERIRYLVGADGPQLAGRRRVRARPQPRVPAWRGSGIRRHRRHRRRAPALFSRRAAGPRLHRLGGARLQRPRAGRARVPAAGPPATARVRSASSRASSTGAAHAASAIAAASFRSADPCRRWRPVALR